ncbi:hypothetical protein HOD83_01935 [Candidatus Woesearchaeota archaeon]|jgi:hypothetical protein|nr:hypothetical protein [Candidatus Woesearchaeota archaeon]MBT4114686.1 hypothetical protein [Candidatus Woesearchaeota archaeon]MBT4248325.1 hypothetical protein [Candidatus Woesearchaeota archaeon]
MVVDRRKAERKGQNREPLPENQVWEDHCGDVGNPDDFNHETQARNVCEVIVQDPVDYDKMYDAEDKKKLADIRRDMFDITPGIIRTETPLNVMIDNRGPMPELKFDDFGQVIMDSIDPGFNSPFISADEKARIEKNTRVGMEYLRQDLPDPVPGMPAEEKKTDGN